MQRLRTYLLTVAGPVRSPHHNVQLAALLALNAGVLNSVGFVAVSVYTSHMTGLTASVADHLVLGGAAIVLTGLLGIATFLAGAAACAVLFNWGRRRSLRGRYANVLVLEALLILLFGLLAEALSWRHRDLLFVGVLCFTMGMQNAIITKISSAQIRTTHVTGMVTDIGSRSASWSTSHAPRACHPSCPIGASSRCSPSWSRCSSAAGCSAPSATWSSASPPSSHWRWCCLPQPQRRWRPTYDTTSVPARARRVDRSSRQIDRWSSHPHGGVTPVTAQVRSRG